MPILSLATSPTPVSELPPSVLAEIARQQRSSEWLMRVIQLGIVAAFGVLYLVSPRTDGATSFSLVLPALGLYAGLAVVGLFWAWRREMPDWAAYLFIAVDVGLLMVLMWSFHVQYAQPPSFYLKAPTFLYLFIFIALRALRFEPRFVVAAGLMSIAAWALMVAYVFVVQDMDGVVTRDYVRYLTGNALLIGAEIDKLIAVGVVTAVLAVALTRARRLLVRAVADASAVQNLSRFFDASVADRIRGTGDVPAQSTRREAAVLFIDLRGFTALAARMEPEAVMRLLAAYQARLVPLVRRHGGVIDKFLGDGIMATFGAVEPRPSYAADALRAVDAVMADVAAWSAHAPDLAAMGPRPLGAAAAAGPLIVGPVGGAARLEFTVIGGPVNLAAKLEKANKTLGCRALTTRETLDLATAQGYDPPEGVRFRDCAIEGMREQTLAVLHA